MVDARETSAWERVGGREFTGMIKVSFLAFIEPKFAEGLSVKDESIGEACVVFCRKTRRQKMQSIS
ncbi:MULTISPECIES: hypothetical protein [Pseudomonas]|jgi:hypothetical protein|uniref:Uncharacterized protein n=1 Tax=Pseudomonas grimontii TaxID=129847 RepID=A0A5C5PMP2_9PSED|nr:hypothetical protein [Pseudomonas grimontii]MCS3515226.1 hypothetical protein [Pseudomonas grimontii]TWR68483.1 hypothetical protein FIV39_08345 [Pseudomonas grimontii]